MKVRTACGWRTVAGSLVLAAGLSLGCSGDGGSGGKGSASAAAGSTAAPTSATPAAPAFNFAKLAQDLEDRKQAYLVHAAQGGGYYAQLSRLELGRPVDRRSIDDAMDFADSRRDTADFKVCALTRIAALHGASPALPADLRDRLKRTLLGFKYWVDEPGQDDMIFWSENHQILFASSELVVGQLYPAEVFPNSGLTGAQHVAKAKPRILRWLDHRLRFGFSEWNSPVYFPHDVAPLLNLIDFAQEAEVVTRASMALDLLLYSVVRLTQKGNFGATAGRTYDEQKLGGRRQGIADLVEVLTGSRGSFKSRGSTAATPFATSRRYRVPHVLLGIAAQPAPRSVDRERVGVDFAQAAGEGIGFASLDDGLFWWGQGAYMAPDTIALSRDMIRTWDLWHTPYFSAFGYLRWAPDSLLSGLSQTLAPLSEGSVLAGANLYTFRNGDAQLSSAVDYRSGRVAFQQHAWQATLDLDAVTFTTAPGNLGRNGPGEWIGSSCLPRVAQVEDVAIVLYDPNALQRATFPMLSHAYFPRSAFDEVVDRGGWVFGRKANGYVALRGFPVSEWKATGNFVGAELEAMGPRSAWICQVGNAAEDGSFADFVNAVDSAQVSVVGAGNEPHGDPFRVDYQAPGLGSLSLDLHAGAALNGSAVHGQDFPRYDGPYAAQAWGNPVLHVSHLGATLEHDRVAGTRSGDGL
jgi:hypothetical protein